MPDKRALSKRNAYLKGGTAVLTKDGPGVIMQIEMRRNTNSGPGTRQYKIKLKDGRIRRYNSSAVEEL